jgi:hypothetical protein
MACAAACGAGRAAGAAARANLSCPPPGSRRCAGVSVAGAQRHASAPPNRQSTSGAAAAAGCSWPAARGPPLQRRDAPAPLPQSPPPPGRRTWNEQFLVPRWQPAASSIWMSASFWVSAILTGAPAGARREWCGRASAGGGGRRRAAACRGGRGGPAARARPPRRALERPGPSTTATRTPAAAITGAGGRCRDLLPSCALATCCTRRPGAPGHRRRPRSAVPSAPSPLAGAAARHARRLRGRPRWAAAAAPGRPRSHLGGRAGFWPV